MVIVSGMVRRYNDCFVIFMDYSRTIHLISECTSRCLHNKLVPYLQIAYLSKYRIPMSRQNTIVFFSRKHTLSEVPYTFFKLLHTGALDDGQFRFKVGMVRLPILSPSKDIQDKDFYLVWAGHLKNLIVPKQCCLPVNFFSLCSKSSRDGIVFIEYSDCDHILNIAQDIHPIPKTINPKDRKVTKECLPPDTFTLFITLSIYPS